MRVGLAGIMIGITTAVSLKRGDRLSAQMISLSLFTEVMTIMTLGLIELS